MRLGTSGELERIGKLAQDLALARGFREPPVERLFGIALRLLHQLAPRAALRNFDHDLAFRAYRQRLFEQLAVGNVAVDEDPPRRRHVLVELDQKASQNLSFRDVVGMRREECAVPPILSATNEEGLDRDRPCLAGEREYVGVAEPFGMHRLAALDVGQSPQAVAIDGGELIILSLGGLRHRLAQPPLHAGRLAREELLRFIHQLGIFQLSDAPDAWRRAALDLVKQARPRTVLEKAVGTAS